jgi:hypothetical protein
VQIRRYEMEDEEVLAKRSTGIPALERAAQTHQAMKERQVQKQRRTLDFDAIACAGNDGSAGGVDAELEEANRGLPLGWKAKRSRRACKGRIYWYHEGGAVEGQWHKPGA